MTRSSKTEAKIVSIWARRNGLPLHIAGVLQGNVYEFQWKEETKRVLYCYSRGWIPATLNLFKNLNIPLDEISAFHVEVDGRIVCR